MVFHDAHRINCSQKLANIPSENQQRLARLNEYSKFQSGGIQTQLEAVPLDSSNAIQSLKLLSISKGVFDPFPAIAGRPLCTDGMWICGCWKPHRDSRSYRVRRIIGSIIKKWSRSVFGWRGTEYVPRSHTRPWISSAICMLPRR